MILLMLIVSLLQAHVIQQPNLASAVQQLCPSGASVSDYQWQEDEAFILDMIASPTAYEPLQITTEGIRQFDLGLTTLPATVSGGPISPNNRYIMLSSDAISGDEAYIYDLVEQTVVRSFNFPPNWISWSGWTSSDRFAYLTYSETVGQLQIKVMNIEGREERVFSLDFLGFSSEVVRAIADNSSDDVFVWSSINQRSDVFLYVFDAHSESQTRLILVNMDSQRVIYDSALVTGSIIAPPGLEIFEESGRIPFWATNGTGVILAMADHHLYLLGVDGQITLLAEVAGTAHYGTISFDGRYVAYFEIAPYPERRYELIVVDLENGGRFRLEGFSTPILWSREGHKLAFARGLRGVAIDIVDIDLCMLGQVREPFGRYNPTYLNAWFNRVPNSDL